jgi:molecular chaperone GrpE
MAKQTDTQKLHEQIAELETNWKRALADYQNLEKRTREQQSVMAQLACLTLIEKLLPVVDHLHMASAHLKDPGLDMVEKQLMTVLTEEGVTPILAANHVFDPTTMECVDQVPGEKDLVLEVVSEGFSINNRVIRPARVRVGNGQTAGTSNI